MKWEMVKLGEVAEVIAGQSPESKYYNKNGDGLPFFQGKADFGIDYPSVRYYCSSPTKVSMPADILMSVRAPVGPTNICNTKACIGRGLAAIRTDKRLNFKYLYHYLKTYEQRLAERSNGSTFSAITTGVVKEIPIPLPPLATQQRIADILDKADALRRKDQALLQKYDELAQAVFVDMFGDPVRNEKGWEVGPVIKNCECIVPGRDKPKSFSGTIPWVTTEDLNHLNFTFHSRKSRGLTLEEVKEVNARVIPLNSVIMTCVGELGIISINKREMVVNQQLHTFQCKENLIPIYLMYNLSNRIDFMKKMASSTTVPYMNKTICNSIPIMYPPVELQLKFEKIILNLNQQLNLQKPTHSTALFHSLLQKAFTGELVP